MISVPFQTILVAIDETEVSERALAAATTLAKALEARLMIVHVLNPHELHRAQSFFASASTDMAEEAAADRIYEQKWLDYVTHYESMLKRKTDEAIAAGIDADFIHPHGSTESVLCELVRTHDVSLLVIGSHQRRGMAEMLLGSTSNYIVHHAPCSILVVYAGDQAVEQVAEQKAVQSAHAIA